MVAETRLIVNLYLYCFSCYNIYITGHRI